MAGRKKGKRQCGSETERTECPTCGCINRALTEPLKCKQCGGPLDYRCRIWVAPGERCRRHPAHWPTGPAFEAKPQPDVSASTAREILVGAIPPRLHRTLGVVMESRASDVLKFAGAKAFARADQRAHEGADDASVERLLRATGDLYTRHVAAEQAERVLYPPGAPVDELDYSAYTDEELATLEQLLEKGRKAAAEKRAAIAATKVDPEGGGEG